jgi:hypothetical protein
MTTYRIVYDVESSKTLTTIMGLLGEVPGVKLVTVHDAANPALPPSPLPPSNAGSRYVSGRKVKSVKGNDLIVDLLQNGPADLDEIKRTFVNNEYAAASAASYISRLLKDGKIERRQHGRFALVAASNGHAVP